MAGVWGWATNPQYLIRIVAAKSCETARKVLIWSLVFLTFFYFCLTQIGLGLRILFPYLHSYFGSDDIFVYAINYLIRSRFSGFFLISVIGACMSTANSQLLLIGSMMSYDVVAQYGKWKKTEDHILGLTQLFYLSWRNTGASALLKSTVQQPVFRRGYLGIVFSNSDTTSLRYALL